MLNETSSFCPYKGLEPFAEADRKYFFGRNRDREVIAANLTAAPLTVLHGASGVGKSSVLMAGVVPKLKTEVRYVVAPRLTEVRLDSSQTDAVGGDSVLPPDERRQVQETTFRAVVVFRNWQMDDFGSALKREVLEACVAILGETTEAAVRIIKKRLAHEDELLELAESLATERKTSTLGDQKTAANKRTLIDALNKFLRLVEGHNNLDLKATPLDDLLFTCRLILGEPIFLIFDQFEEYFLYHPPSAGKDSFDAELARAVNRQDVDANFLLSLREDGLSKLDRFQGRIPNLLSNMLRLQHLDRESATQAILQPLQEYNLKSPGHLGPVEIEGALVDKLLDEVQTGRVTLDQTGQGHLTADGNRSSSAARIETPFLQMVLMRLWDEEYRQGSRKLRLITLTRLGGAETIVRTHLDSVMTQLSEADPDYPEVAARLFRFLVTPAGMKIANTLGTLASWTELPEDRIRPVVGALLPVRILRAVEPPPGQASGTRFEIFHDVLAPAILDWRARHATLLEQQEAAQQRQRAEREARSARRFRRLSFAFAIVSLVAVGLAIFAFSEQAQARANKTAADAAESRAKVNLSLAEGEKTKAEEARYLAQAANEAAEGERVKADRRKSEAEAAEAKARDAALKAESERKGKVLESQRARAENLSAQAQRLSASGPERKRVSDYYDQSVRLFSQTGDLRRQAETLREAAEVFVTIADKIAEGTAIGEFDWEGSQEEVAAFENKAVGSLKQAQLLYQRLERNTTSHTQEGDTLRSLADFYMKRDDNKEAAKYYQQANNLYSDKEDVVSKTNVAEKLGKLFRYTDRRKAVDYYLNLLTLLESQNGRYRDEDDAFEESIEETLLTIGDLYSWLNQKQEARAYYSRVLPSDDADNRRSAWLRVGQIDYDQGNRSAALESFLKAAPPPSQVVPSITPTDIGAIQEYQLRMLLFRREDAYALGAVGALFYELNDKQHALEYFEAAIVLYQKRFLGVAESAEGIFAYHEAADVLASISKIHSDLGDQKKAEEYKARAASTNRTLEHFLASDRDWVSTYREVGQLYESLGNLKRADEFYWKAKEAESKK